MDLQTVRKIRDFYLAMPVGERGPAMLKSLTNYRGCGPAYNLYNQMTVVQGCDFLLTAPDITVDSMDIEISSYEKMSIGPNAFSVQNGYRTVTVDRKSLVSYIEGALETVQHFR